MSLPLSLIILLLSSSSQLRHDDARAVPIKRGLLVQRLEPGDRGVYTCTAHEHSYSQVLARYRLHVIAQRSLASTGRYQHQQHQQHQQHHLNPNHRHYGAAQAPRSSWPAQGSSPQAAAAPVSSRSYKDLLMAGSNSLSLDEYCEQLWYREKRRQQKLRAHKLKQESRKARVRRNFAPEGSPPNRR